MYLRCNLWLLEIFPIAEIQDKFTPITLSTYNLNVGKTNVNKAKELILTWRP